MKKTNQRKSEPSSETNLPGPTAEDIALAESEAQNLDFQLQPPPPELPAPTEEPPPEPARRGRPPGKKNKNAKRDEARRLAREGGGSEGTAAEVQLVYDPGFESMLVDVTGEFVDLAKRKYNWSEPGAHWREKTGAALSRLLQRIQPMKPGPLSDLITLGGYLALWAVPNVISSNGVNAGEASPGNDGKREDSQNEGTGIG